MNEGIGQGERKDEDAKVVVFKFKTLCPRHIDWVRRRGKEVLGAARVGCGRGGRASSAAGTGLITVTVMLWPSTTVMDVVGSISARANRWSSWSRNVPVAMAAERPGGSLGSVTTTTTPGWLPAAAVATN